MPCMEGSIQQYSTPYASESRPTVQTGLNLLEILFPYLILQITGLSTMELWMSQNSTRMTSNSPNP